jgi:hypothetical protein
MNLLSESVGKTVRVVSGFKFFFAGTLQRKNEIFFVLLVQGEESAVITFTEKEVKDIYPDIFNTVTVEL